MLNITKIEITKEIERQKFNSLFYSVVGGDEGVFINEQRGEEKRRRKNKSNNKEINM
jgi:hypothetical protein|tara:strand:- start:155 stop:325 length:171 start_codon:yes stop_codon:yes gene_type:complete